MTFDFDKKLFLYLSLTFLLMTVIGTVSHEYGHYTAGKILGIDSTVSYGMTSPQNNTEISRREAFLFTLGGPIQTIATGTLGLLLLYVFRKSFHGIEKLLLPQWAMVFLALFWLRQLTNMFTWILFYFINGRFGRRGDEIKLAKYLELPNWSLLLATAIIAAMVLCIVLFKFLPKRIRFTFMVAGLFGGISGYVLWLRLLGKIIMP